MRWGNMNDQSSGNEFPSLGPVILKDDSVIWRFDLGKKYELLEERE